ncbi:MAG: SDR family oxidoreductase [Terriglobia bacterium]|jgi:short-subunit dehydrogenase
MGVPSVLILGATSAIASALASEFAAHKFDLVLGGRDREELGALASDLSLRYGVRAGVLSFDALDTQTHASTLRSFLSGAGNALEGVVVCTGYMGDQAKGQCDWEEARRILETNFTGCVSALNILANHFEPRRAGFICALSSVAGDRGRQSNYLYGAAKAGLSTFLQGLRNRLFHANVKVITVKPGFVDTRMTYGRPGLFLVASPESVAKGIFRAIAKGKDVVYLPWFWRLIMLVVQSIPEAMFKRLRT